MLEGNLYVVSEKAKMFSSRESYVIRNGFGEEIGSAEQSTGMFAKLWGAIKGPPSTQIDFREKPDNSLVFTVRRRGFLFKKVEVVDAQGKIIGQFKAKRFSLKGGYHVYDGAGKHVAEIRGKLLKFEYVFYAPDGKTEMGKVSKKWGGAMKELFTSADTYGVEIKPAYVDDPKTKMLILGAAVAMDCLFGAKSGAVVAAGGGDDDEESSTSSEKEE